MDKKERGRFIVYDESIAQVKKSVKLISVEFRFRNFLRLVAGRAQQLFLDGFAVGDS
jgi:hypothetical protein